MRRALLVALVAAPAFAQTVYTWEDSSGVHYADDLGLVPAEVRRASEKAGRAQPGQARVPSTKATPGRRDVGAPPSEGTVVAEAPRAPAPSPAPAPALDESSWRRRFVDVYRRIQTSKDTLAALARSMPPRVDCVAQPQDTATVQPVGGAPGTTVVVQAQPSQRCEVNLEHDRMRASLALEEVCLADAQRDLEQLERDASLAHVPREWRRGW
jgi:hypothetical protein